MITASDSSRNPALDTPSDVKPLSPKSVAGVLIIGSFPPPNFQYSLVRPHAVFAASRRAFDAEVHEAFDNNHDVKGILFRSLPLEEEGWDFNLTHISRVGGNVWHAERC